MSGLLGSRGLVTEKEESLALAGYNMFVMLERQSSRMPTFRTKGSKRASLLSSRACCSRKKGAIVAIGHGFSCSATVSRSALYVQPTMEPWHCTIVFGQTSLT